MRGALKLCYFSLAQVAYSQNISYLVLKAPSLPPAPIACEGTQALKTSYAHIIYDLTCSNHLLFHSVGPIDFSLSEFYIHTYIYIYRHLHMLLVSCNDDIMRICADAIHYAL